MKKTIYLLLLILVQLPTSLCAEQISIQQCREMALQHNKSRQSASLATQAAEFTRRATWAQFFPSFSAVGFGLYDTGDGGLNIEGGMLPVGSMATGSFVPAGSYAYFPGLNIDYEVGAIYTGAVLLKQPLYMGGKIQAAYRMTKLGVEIRQQQERLTEAEVLQQADEAYAKVVNARELQEVAEKYKALLEELDRNVESAVRLGLKMENDRMKVQVKLSEVELQMRRAQNGVRLATMNLCHVIGVPLHTDLQVETEYPQVNEVEGILSNDVSMRPEFAMLEAKTQLADQQVRLARSEMLPRVALLAKYGYTHGIEFNNRYLLEGWNFAGGVTVSIPLYHFGERTNKVRAAKTQLLQTQTEQADKTEMMMLELAQAANKLDEARLEVELSEKSLAEAETSMMLSGKQYKAGVETLSDYLESQAMWQRASESQVTAHFQLYLASVDYLRAAGRLVSEQP